MDLFYWQLIFIVTVFLLAVCGSFWPLVALKWKLKQKEGSVVEDFKDSKAISLGNSLACGVFFGLCFLHLVPHSAHKWNEIFELSNHTMYEKRDEHHHHKNSNLLAPFLILFSFTIMLFFEKNELCCKQKSSENLPIIILTQPSISEEEQPSNNELSTSLEDITENKTEEPSFHRDYISFGDLQLVSENPKRYGALRSMSIVSDGKSRGMGCNKSSIILSTSDDLGGTKVAFFIFGLAFHNLLEGLTLGLQTDLSAAFSLFIAILIHGFFLATAATTTLLHFWLPKDLTFYSMATYLLLLCLVRPFGIVLGLCVVQIPGLTAMIIAATLQSLSTGVFIYITFMSLIPDEYQRSQQNEGNIKMSIKIFAFTTGWSILVLLSLIASH